MADKTLTKNYKVPNLELNEADKVLQKSKEENEYLNDLIKRRQENFNKQLSGTSEISDLNRNNGIKLDKDILEKVKAKWNIPGEIDPKLLAEEGVKDINIGGLAKNAKLKALGRILKGSSKALPLLGLGLDIATTPEVGEGSDIVPGKPTFDQMYPKINRTLAGKQ